jgi:SAM-dependent methyltransferase
MSETAKWRHLFLPYCKGNGIDIGYGGDPIVPESITFDREWSHPSHARVGERHQDITGDAAIIDKLVKPRIFDYVYSSHCIEDFNDTKDVLNRWIELLKPGGYLCLLFPDEQRFRFVSSARNIDHVHLDMGLDYMVKILTNIPNISIIESQELFSSKDGSQPDYNCMIVAKKEHVIVVAKNNE